jgi:hypothetical protein
MIVTARPFRLSQPDGDYRNPGIHLSQIIRDLALRGKLLDAKYEGKLDPDALPACVCLGIAWEEWLSKLYPEMVFHPGERQLEGIYMNPDGIEVFERTLMGTSRRTYDLRVHEFKLTWKSSRRKGPTPEAAELAEKVRIMEEWMWMTQLKAYCKESGTRWGALHVFWVNGNYMRGDSDPFSEPYYSVWDIEFTQREIDENWEMLRNHRDFMLNQEGE